jgi:hypothetical protein
MAALLDVDTLDHSYQYPILSDIARIDSEVRTEVFVVFVADQPGNHHCSLNNR